MQRKFRGKEMEYGKPEVQLKKSLSDNDILNTCLKTTRQQLKDAEKEITERNRWTTFLTENTHQAIICIDTEGHCCFSNMPACKLFGANDSGDLLGQQYSSVLHLFHPGTPLRSYSHTEDPIYLTLKHNRKIHAEKAVLENQNKKRIPVEYWTHPVIDHGSIIAVFILIDDKSDRQQLESQIQQYSKVSVMGELVDGISHDFNNLLTIIQGNLEFILNEHLDNGDPINKDWMNQLHDMLEDCYSAAKDSTELTSSLLMYTHKQNSQQKQQTIDELLQTLPGILKRIFDKSIPIKLNIEESLPNIKVDQHLFNNALLNLATNAKNAMPNGGKFEIEAGSICINGATSDLPDQTLRGQDILKPGSYVLITIADSGIGMSKETLQQVFEPFFTTKGESNGLGMSMVNEFIDQSDAHIHIESKQRDKRKQNEDHGTKIYLYFPVIDANDEELDITGENPIVYPRGEEKILLIDDEPRVRKIIAIYLKDLGYQITEADSADAAISILEQQNHQFKLVLSDIIMPGKRDGHDLAVWITENQPDIKVILISGHDFMKQEADKKIYVNCPLLKKPFTKEKLAEYVRQSLETTDTIEDYNS